MLELYLISNSTLRHIMVIIIFNADFVDRKLNASDTKS